LIGLLSARELAEAGLSVTVVEQGAVGRESSWAGGGILSPLHPWRYPEPVTALGRWSERAYPRLAEALAQGSGIDPEWTRSGALILDVAERAPALAWAARGAAHVQLLQGTALRAAEPALAAHIDAGLWLPEVAQIRNPRLVKALQVDLRARGVLLREHTPVQRLLIGDGGIAGVETTHGALTAARVVVAAGAWSGELLATAGLRLAIEPVRGQMLLIAAPAGLLTRILVRGEHYLIPRRDGRVLVGSTVERVGFDKSVSTEVRSVLHQAALELVPGLAGCPIEAHWAGLRPGSASGVPCIGEHPRVPRLFLNTGHFRNGVALAPASTRLLADLLLGRSPALDPAPYAPLAEA
jgi:glycine oxidase